MQPGTRVKAREAEGGAASTVNGGLANEWEGLANLSPPRQLDIGHGQDWDALRDEIAHEAGARKFSGTIMREPNI